jgi:hypothetical protein
MSYIPQKGDYNYHYKHDPAKGVLNYAYQIFGLALHSETEEVMVAYRPLYSPNHVWDRQCDFNIRPLDMFCEEKFESKGQIINQRFRKIEGEELEQVKQELVKQNSG